jgi:hypothetical protein
MWYTAMGLHKTMRHKNNSKTSIQSLALSKFTLHSDLQITFVVEEIDKLSTLSSKRTQTQE